MITELLKGGNNYDRFMQKIGKYDAAHDDEEGGGVSLLDDNDYEAQNPEWGVIQPEVLENDLENNPNVWGDYPPLSSKSKTVTREDVDTELSSKLGTMLMDGDSESVTTGSTVNGNSQPTKPPAWSNGKTTKTLFPKSHNRAPSSVATSSVAQSDFSVEQYDRRMDVTEGINLLNTRFWDPASRDWNPDRFYDTVTQAYYCPFVCE